MSTIAKTPALRPGLPSMPERIERLPIDARGYPVPFFVAWVNGEPDHRIVDPAKLTKCVKERRCWVCGEPLGRFLVFTLGPMCCITRTSGEPPAHLGCALFSVQACPFLSRPHAHRREAGMPEGIYQPAGDMLKRNPGVSAVWTCRDYKPFRAYGGNEGVLFHVGDPQTVRWYAEGRPAEAHEVEASIVSGLPKLIEAACSHGSNVEQGKELDALAAYVLPVYALLEQMYPTAGVRPEACLTLIEAARRA
jgi:hypothetical protein